MDYINDSSYIEQLITEYPYSIFPQMLKTERVDRVCNNLVEGKIAIILEGSPFVLTIPHVFAEHLQNPEDFYSNWVVGTFIRVLRFIGILLALIMTPTYVAIISFHYMMIPTDMLQVLGESRATVPFSPLVEALLIEIAGELLRESGSRLPRRIGQTVGIVGGIIIGQAAVSAGLTSNVLIILVSVSILSSLVIPSYSMSNAVRVLRFPLIVLAGFMGILGLMVGFLLIVIYLCRLESYGIPYFEVIRPSRILHGLLRLPLNLEIGRAHV